MRLSLISVLLCCLVLGSGCAGSRIPDEHPQTLRDVNQQLEKRWARIQRADGGLIERIADVQVGVDSTTFYHRMEERWMTIPTGSVQQVQIRGTTGTGKGSIIGATPGVALAFVGGGVALSNSGDENYSAGLAVAFGLAMIAGGLALGTLGAISGALIGDVASDEEWLTIYEKPVEKYRT